MLHVPPIVSLTAFLAPRTLPVDDAAFWAGAFAVVSIEFDIKFYSNPNPNQASVRYIENVTTTDGLSLGLAAPCTEYPFSFTILQHEHALVEVDNDCKIKKWDQYGDDAEQAAVDTTIASLTAAVSTTASTCATNS